MAAPPTWAEPLPVSYCLEPLGTLPPGAGRLVEVDAEGADVLLAELGGGPLSTTVDAMTALSSLLYPAPDYVARSGEERRARADRYSPAAASAAPSSSMPRSVGSGASVAPAASMPPPRTSARPR